MASTAMMLNFVRKENTMQWDYRTAGIEVVTEKTLLKNLEYQGNDGFELVTILQDTTLVNDKTGTVLIFKKPRT
jgi:hypothetical protein